MTERRIAIREVGPREGFQFEPVGISTEDKAKLITALSRTGITAIQTVSFVSPRSIPQMADADAVLELVEPVEGVTLGGLWFNVKGLQRALNCPVLTVVGLVAISASAAFAKRNWNSDSPGMENLNRPLLDAYEQLGLPVTVSVAAAFGCNFQGRISVSDVLGVLEPVIADVRARKLPIIEICLSDTMAWGNPNSTRDLVPAVMSSYPSIPIRLHLHDTRGLGLANAVAGIEVGVDRFDAAIAGMGGCPYAGHRGAAGNIATEDFVLLCQEMGFETDVDQRAILEAAALAEEIMGHPGSGRSLRGGHLLDSGVLVV